MTTRHNKASAKLVVLFAILFMAGCGPRLEVTSSTTWSGAVGSTRTGGVRSVGPYSGNHTFDGDDCGTFQKSGTGGALSARVVYKGLVPRKGSNATTSAPYGVVSVCGGD